MNRSYSTEDVGDVLAYIVGFAWFDRFDDRKNNLNWCYFKALFQQPAKVLYQIVKNNVL